MPKINCIFVKNLVMENLNQYPAVFLTKAMCLFHKSEIEVSADGTPRYVPNPNASGTYSLKVCMEEYTPIYGKIKI